MTSDIDPFVGSPPPEVPLSRAPLARVIAQVRFPLVNAVAQREFVTPFQEAVRARYPVLRQQLTQGVLLTAAGVAPVQAQPVWRFTDVDGRWRVSLAPSFLAIETTAYTSRSEFLGRLRDVVAPLHDHVEPQLVDRLGVRYIDRLGGKDVDDIGQLVRPEVRGIAGTAASAHAEHILAECTFALGDARLLARWGRLPAQATVDPAALEPTNEASWILDLDMFSAGALPFSTDRVVGDAGRFAERIYAVFRWAVTDEFLRRFGGRP